MRKRDLIKHLAIVLVLISLLPATAIHGPKLKPAAVSVPSPLLAYQHPVDWWFVFKLNASKFPDCGGAARACPFGGTVETYKVGQQYAFASSESPTLKQGAGCAGDTGSDPIGATFEQVYNGAFHYLIWNDQFYNDLRSMDVPALSFSPSRRCTSLAIAVLCLLSKKNQPHRLASPTSSSASLVSPRFFFYAPHVPLRLALLSSLFKLQVPLTRLSSTPNCVAARCV